MPMLKDPSQKYLPFEFAPHLPDRTWPASRDRLNKAPRWMSSDLRDGNQALANPMNVEQKTKFFNLLVECGMKEIEVGYPMASETEQAFVRELAEGRIHVPDDVSLQVMTAAREDLIRKTFECIRGVKKAVICTYNGSCRTFRKVVYQYDQQKIIDLAVKAVKLVRQLADEATAEGCKTEWQLCYGPEGFSQTEPDFIVELLDAVVDAWYGNRDRSKEAQVIITLASTVESSPPCDFADQIEYICRNIADRDSVCISLHCHNDRGTAVASTEMGLMAGADRVEGCLFGNGERSGNVDLVTLALNLYTQGIWPNLDFSDLNRIIEIVTDCTKLPIHPRHPYAGELVHTAFSGSHQDAIKKGLALREKTKAQIWEMPYLAIDPEDIGASYEAIIRTNSQSGKGGFSAVILRRLSLDMPRKMQTEFYNVAMVTANSQSREITTDELESIFRKNYFYGKGHEGRFVLANSKSTTSADGQARFEGLVTDLVKATEHRTSASGKTFSEAILNALNKQYAQFDVNFSLREQSHHSLANGSTAAFVELSRAKAGKSIWGVGVADTVDAAIAQAVVSGVNGFQKDGVLKPTGGQVNVHISGLNGQNGILQEVVKEVMQGLNDGKTKVSIATQ